MSIKDHRDYLELDAESVGLDEHLEEFLGPELIGHNHIKSLPKFYYLALGGISPLTRYKDNMTNSKRQGREGGVGIGCLVVSIILLYCDI